MERENQAARIRERELDHQLKEVLPANPTLIGYGTNGMVKMQSFFFITTFSYQMH